VPAQHIGMKTAVKAVVGTVTAALALWVGWGLYVTRTTDRIPSETIGSIDGISLRRYPELVSVETTAPDSITAFRRLFGYISGDNEAAESVAMTTPVRTDGATIAMTAPVRTLAREAEQVSMTAPVRRTDAGDAVRMAFYLPAEYDADTAPRPTDPAVALVVDPPRTTAVRRFSWYATDARVARERARLLDTLAAADIAWTGEVSVLQYNDPWTPPFLRTNEVEVPIPESAVD